MSEAASERATERRRRAWSVRREGLESDEPPVLPPEMTIAERLHYVWELSREIYAMAGQTGCDLPREQWPIRVIRPER